ncbi:MAG: D-alanyl-D-alanine carboxypeptidase [Clostridiales bacterium]|nr:D-alanyl-D-alanine carboxypeptidase [Clostridiales bacterium]
MRRTGKRFLGLLAAVLIFLSLAPRALADDYDPLYPELLSEGHLSAASAILIEADSGEVIFEKNADQRMYPASTTKILTVWLALTNGDPEQKYTVSENAVNLAADESSAKLAAGEQMRLIDLCYAAMLPSGNDAATAIAEGLAGSVWNFTAMMNQAAYSLGCKNTQFVNANGLHDENHFTTARDMAILARIAMQNETFRQIVLASEYTLPRDNIYRARTIKNLNYFVAKTEGRESRYYPYSTGIKTGTTSAAGNCLVASASKDGVNLISVVFGSASDESRYTDTVRLMDYGFAQYLSTSIAEIYAMNPRVVEVRNFALDDPQVGKLPLSLRMVSTDASDLIVTTRQQVDYWVQNFASITVTDFTRDLRAPIQEGEVMGTLTYYPEIGNPVMYELLAGRSIAAREQIAPTSEEIISAAMADPNPFPRITVELVMLYLVLPALGIFLLIRLIRALIKIIRKRIRVKVFKPTSRYFR